MLDDADMFQSSYCRVRASSASASASASVPTPATPAEPLQHENVYRPLQSFGIFKLLNQTNTALRISTGLLKPTALHFLNLPFAPVVQPYSFASQAISLETEMSKSASESDALARKNPSLGSLSSVDLPSLDPAFPRICEPEQLSESHVSSSSVSVLVAANATCVFPLAALVLVDGGDRRRVAAEASVPRPAWLLSVEVESRAPDAFLGWYPIIVPLVFSRGTERVKHVALVPRSRARVSALHGLALTAVTSARISAAVPNVVVSSAVQLENRTEHDFEFQFVEQLTSPPGQRSR